MKKTLKTIVKDHTIEFQTEFNKDDIEAYMMAIKEICSKLKDEDLATSTELLRDFKIVFENKTYKNLLEFASEALGNYDSDFQDLEDVTLNLELAEKFHFKNIDFEKEIITLDNSLSKGSALFLLTNFPHLIGFKIKHKNKTYPDASSLAKDLFKGFTLGQLAFLTNEAMDKYTDALKDRD